MLLNFVQEQDPVVVILKFSDSPEVTPVADPLKEFQVFATGSTLQLTGRATIDSRPERSAANWR